MSITKDMVVSIHYTLKDDEGNTLDQSANDPLAYLHGHSNIIPGLENALAELKTGDKKVISVPPEQGYGLYNEQLKFTLPKEQLGGDTPEPGMMVQMTSPEGSALATIVSVDDKQVHLDANHPLAGKTLHFDVTVAEVRPATQEELQHGHPHGPGGHHH